MDMAAGFTISNGQIFTPGLSVLNAPQPGTPLGGETLHVSLDVTANGRLPLPPMLESDSPTQIFNITMFLYSYETGRNFTVSNGTESGGGASLGDIMAQEDGSTVKHINWVWPDCLVGNGRPDGEGSDRGDYNISIRQNFRFNGEDYYTVFDVPISVTNSIEESDDRPPCDSLANALLSPEEIDAGSANSVGVLFAPDDAVEVEFDAVDDNNGGNGSNNDDNDDNDDNDNDANADENQGGYDDGNGDGPGFAGDEDQGDFGGTRPEGDPGDGLGSAASTLSLRGSLMVSCTMMMLAMAI